MRNISLFFMLAIMAFGAFEGGAVHFFRAAFPSDFTHREALERCSMNDAKFSRFAEEERDSCYRDNHLAASPRDNARPTDAPPKAPTGAAPRSSATVIVKRFRPRRRGPIVAAFARASETPS